MRAGPPPSAERRCAFCNTPSARMRILEPCAFLPRNGDDSFQRKSPMRIRCNDFQHIFARAMFFSMISMHFHMKLQFPSKKTKVFLQCTDFEGRVFRSTFLMRRVESAHSDAPSCDVEASSQLQTQRHALERNSSDLRSTQPSAVEQNPCEAR